MTYLHKKSAEEQKEACQQAHQLMAICEKLSITLDPIDWQSAGMRANVTVKSITISDLLNLSQLDSDSILRRVRIKLFERAALETMHAHPSLKALIWSPVEVVQPQEFLSLWVITLDTDKRIAIAEYIKNGQRVYEHYELDVRDEQHLTRLFGPMQAGAHQLGERITIEEHEQKYTGEIIYILLAAKAVVNRKYLSRGYHTTLGKVSTSDLSSKYLVDCHDGFPHIINPSQVIESPPQTE